MKKNIFVIFLLLVSVSLFAATKGNGHDDYRVGRYVIPSDSDVLVNYNIIESQEPLYPLNIKVLVWNMYKGAKLSWLENFQHLSLGKDLLLLQEVYLNNKMVDAFNETKEFHYKTATYKPL
jgi:hypothetical protein